MPKPTPAVEPFAPLDFLLDTTLIPTLSSPSFLATHLRAPPTRTSDDPNSTQPRRFPVGDSAYPAPAASRVEAASETRTGSGFVPVSLNDAKAHLKAQKVPSPPIQSTGRHHSPPSTTRDPHAHAHGHGSKHKHQKPHPNASPDHSSSLPVPPPRVSSKSAAIRKRASITEGQLNKLRIANPDPSADDEPGSNLDPNRNPYFAVVDVDKPLLSVPGEASKERKGRPVPSPRRGSAGGSGSDSTPKTTQTTGTSQQPSRSFDTVVKKERGMKSHARSASVDQASSVGVGIRLCSEGDTVVSDLLHQLHSLSPPSRLVLPSANDPDLGCVLHPAALLTPLSILLESLVCERSVLRHPSHPVPSLEPLPSGSRLQLSLGHGELDWRVVAQYATSLGDAIRALLPYLARFERKDEVEVLMRSVRAHVIKMKKVFRQVGDEYGDGYGFLRGWWEDKWLKQAAAEMATWADLFDA